MQKNIIIILLVALVAWLSFTVIRLEKYHYASVVGMCSELSKNEIEQEIKQHSCLHSKETRTNPIWHLVYAPGGE